MYNNGYLAFTGAALGGIALGWWVLTAFALIALGVAVWRMRPENKESVLIPEFKMDERWGPVFERAKSHRFRRPGA